MRETRTAALRGHVDQRLNSEFHSSGATSDDGLPTYWGSDPVFKAAPEDIFNDGRIGQNTRHTLTAWRRLSVFSRLASEEDTDDAKGPTE